MVTLTRDRARVVVLDCAVEIWGDPRVRDLFCRIVELKLKGYGAKYPAHVVPLEKVDFVGTHVLLCQEEADGVLVPVSGIKYVTADRCREFLMPFKGLSVLEDAHAKVQLEVVHDWVETLRYQVGYTGSWTTHPDVRHRGDIAELIHDWLALSQVRLMEETGVAGICATGILRVGAARIIEDLIGFRPIRSGENILPPFGQRELNDEPALMMQVEKFNPEGLRRAERARSLWENRVVLADSRRLEPSRLREAA